MNPSSPALPQTDGLAIASLVLGILSVLLGPFGSIPAIICGHLAHGRIRRDPLRTGQGLATAGLIIGYLTLFLVVTACFMWVGKTGMIPQSSK